MVGRELISEDEARALWRRAGELQSRAEDREEYSVAPVLEDEHALSADEVLAAAEGAGIVTDHVRVALVERGLPDLAWRTRGDWMGLLRFLTCYETDAIERVVLVNAAPERVLHSLEQLLSGQPYALIASEHMAMIRFAMAYTSIACPTEYERSSDYPAVRIFSENSILPTESMFSSQCVKRMGKPANCRSVCRCCVAERTSPSLP
jgi:hypothetical protein